MDCCNLRVWDRKILHGLQSYDTANGMDCCNLLFLLLRSSSFVTIPRTVWTVATSRFALSAARRMRYDTANGMDCCNFKVSAPLTACADSYDTANGMDCCNAQYGQQLRADHSSYDTANGMDCCNSRKYGAYRLHDGVTIPRTVWTVATCSVHFLPKRFSNCYDTANGMDCCNGMYGGAKRPVDFVTIPRTVWTVATLKHEFHTYDVSLLRYRERYGLLQHDWMNVKSETMAVTIPRTVWTVATGCHWCV